jgi:hypothetical protein
MNTLFELNFPTMAGEFNDQIPQTLNLNLKFFFQRFLQSFVHPFCHNDFVWFKKVVFAIIAFHFFLNAVLNGLK